MKLYRFLILACVLFMSSCVSFDPTDYNEHLDKAMQMKSFDLNMYEMKADFCGAKYSGIRDVDIKKISTVKTLKNGNVVLVEYTYGVADMFRYYYVDINGNTAKLKKTGVSKANGYPSVDSFTRDINSDGFVVYDWFSIILVITFIIGLLLWWFVG